MSNNVKAKLFYCLLGLFGFIVNLVFEFPQYLIRIFVSILVGLVIGTISEFCIRKIHYLIKSVVIKALILSTVTTTLLMVFQVYILGVSRGGLTFFYYLFMFITIFVVTYAISKYQIKRDEYLQSKLDEFKKDNEIDIGNME